MGQRSTSRSTDDREDGLVVGLIHSPHGLHGEVTVDIRSDVPDRFRVGAQLACDGVGPLTITGIRGDAKARIVRFKGYTDRASADELSKRFLRVSRDEARRATKGAYLWADLVGLRAQTADGSSLGDVSDVLRAGENDVLVLRGPSGERLVPMLESTIVAVDVPGGTITVRPQEYLS
ncbi:MAG: 16S rRNA processing protein RimM [Chloroflexi bacterium]|nr:16S rRNA processing protein RimM [Chloroflexota bacterium]